MSFALHGLGASKGVAMGPAYIVSRHKPEINKYTITRDQIEEEVTRFQEALKLAREQLQRVRDQIPMIYPVRDGVSQEMANEIASFIEPHLLMLEDTMLTQAPIEIIENERCNAEWALKQQRDKLAGVFEAMEDPYLRSRKDDVDQVVNRVQRLLLNHDNPLQDTAYPTAPGAQTIVLADDLTPADTVLMQHQGISGFITEHGGMTSHTAILARSLGIPAIVGLHHALRYIRQDDSLVIDGHNGVVVINPDRRSMQHFRARQAEEKRRRQALSKLRSAPCKTHDGEDINLQANIELPEDMDTVKRTGAKSIGLYRTEFLYMNADEMPDEEAHFQAYARVVEAMGGGIINIRTLDLGADKQVDGGWQSNRQLATNPALGLRAVRLCLKETMLFRTQLRAVLRASSLGKVHMMIPMLSTIQELHQVLRMIEDIQNELTQEGLPFDPNMPVGAMVEVPSMALCIDMFMPHLDFVSIGTNDLIQYTLAIDRVDDAVNYLYDPLNPAVLRLLKNVIKTAKNAGKSVSMCGEMASDQRYVRLLLGMGLRNFSVNPESLLEVKEVINGSRLRGLKRMADRVLNSEGSEEAEEWLTRMNKV
ncbi:MAG: phosphoenolpyruvate--protein phosphotransferase [Pseudomonadota bacterium]